MIISLHWLSKYLDVKSLDIKILSSALTKAGVEVEKIYGFSQVPKKVSVAKVLSWQKHPNADRLRLCKVDDGKGKIRQIVCGAKNFVKGNLVALAIPGAKLAADFVIKKSKIRGELSEGMLCSVEELDIETLTPINFESKSNEEDGILILPQTCKLGESLRQSKSPEIQGLTAMELEITPNRPDLLSHLGVAREISAILQIPLLTKKVSHIGHKSLLEEAPADWIRIDACECCSIYSGRIIRGVKVGESPTWLKQDLQSVGLQPINNIVDISNYVLLDMGQPLHAFDFAKIKNKIIVRQAKEGEELLCLDGVKRSLKAEDCVIADEEKALAIAGIIGGQASAVVEHTKDILLESACFASDKIRRSARRLEISTDSSYRFERGVDSAQSVGASEYACELISEICGGKAEDKTSIAGLQAKQNPTVELKHKAVNELIGFELNRGEIINTLSRLRFELLDDKSESSKWRIPTYRKDITRHIDLVEEIVRLMGMEKISAKQNGFFANFSRQDLLHESEILCKRNLAQMGFCETLSLKLISREDIDLCLFTPKVERKNPVLIKNPLGKDSYALTPSLLPGLLKSAEHNVKLGSKSLRLFEIAPTFTIRAGHLLEEKSLAMLLSGDPRKDEQAGFWQKHFFKEDNQVSVLLGCLRRLLPNDPQFARELKISTQKSNQNLPVWGKLRLGAAQVGAIGFLSPTFSRRMNWSSSIAVLEISLKSILTRLHDSASISQPSKFPGISRDLAVVADSNFPQAKVANFLESKRKTSSLLKSFKLFDVFQDNKGEHLPADKKSFAYRLDYSDDERTLRSQEVDELHRSIVRELQRALPVRERN